VNGSDVARPALEAYIKSQAHEGWRLVPERYDDGGLSGASLDRPALQSWPMSGPARSLSWWLQDLMVPFDYLVVATGATHSYFGKDAWARYAPGLKGVDDATAIRRRVCSKPLSGRRLGPEHRCRRCYYRGRTHLLEVGALGCRRRGLAGGKVAQGRIRRRRPGLG
jgi:hypothetical protein